MGNNLKKLLVIAWIMAVCTGCREDTVIERRTEDTSTVSVAASVGDAGYSQAKRCAVYVCGAVAEPDVYYLPEGSIKQEAVELAGGFAEGAARFYVNLAEAVVDGERIYVPYEDELQTQTGEAGADYGGNEGTKVNINTAGVEELTTLPGIGESKAKAIIAYREENGGFSSIEDICNVSGIKENSFNNIKDYIDVN